MVNWGTILSTPSTIWTDKDYKEVERGGGLKMMKIKEKNKIPNIEQNQNKYINFLTLLRTNEIVLKRNGLSN